MDLSLRTQPSRALHGNTPFFMVYGSEAVLSVDLIFGAPRLTFESIAEAEATRLEGIDVLGEERLNMVLGLCFVAEGLVGRSGFQMKLFVWDGRRFLFMKLRHYKPT
jgi:hypothetical protein